MRRLAAVSMLGLTLAARAGAQEPPDAVLEALVQHALAHSPELASAGARAAAAAEAPGTEGGLPSPMVSVLYTNDGWAPTLGEMEMTSLGVMASQALPDPGRRRLRTRMAERGAAEARQRERRVRLDVVESITRAYHDLRLAHSLAAVAVEQETLWQEIEASVRARYAAGLAPQLDVMRAQVEVTRARERVIVRRADASVRLFELNRRAARPLDQPLEPGRPLALTPLAETADALLAAAEADSPELQAAREAAESRRLGVSLARRGSRPELTVQAGYMNRGGLDPMWQAGLGVSWPFFAKGRVRAGVAVAAQEEKAGERDVEAARADVLLRTRQRLTRLDALAQAAALYENGILPQGRLALEAALAQYRAGRAPLVSVLDALAALSDDRATHLERVAAHESLKARALSFSLEPDDGAMPGSGGGMGGRRAMGAAAAAPMAANGASMAPAPADAGGDSGMGEGR